MTHNRLRRLDEILQRARAGFLVRVLAHGTKRERALVQQQADLRTLRGGRARELLPRHLRGEGYLQGSAPFSGGGDGAFGG